jgi:hypothetical protein
MKLTKTIVAGLLVLGMGSAFAAEPVAQPMALNDTQMDNVSAGSATAIALAGPSAAVGLFAAATQDTTLASVAHVGGYFVASSASKSAGVGF